MYQYSDQKQRLFTDEGQKLFLQIRDRVQGLLSKSGAVRLQEAIRGSSGDSWDMLACVDRLAELGELREIPYGAPVTQARIFVSGRHEG